MSQQPVLGKIKDHLYQKVLGLEPGPVTYHALLGLPVEEASADRIAEAAERRIIQLRPYQQGVTRAAATQVMSEIEAARKTLSTPRLRQAYHRKLQQQGLLTAAATTAHAAAFGLQQELDETFSAAALPPRPLPAPTTPHTPTPRGRQTLHYVIAGGIALIACGGLLGGLYWLGSAVEDFFDPAAAQQRVADADEPQGIRAPSPVPTETAATYPMPTVPEEDPVPRDDNASPAHDKNPPGDASGADVAAVFPNSTAAAGVPLPADSQWWVDFPRAFDVLSMMVQDRNPEASGGPAAPSGGEGAASAEGNASPPAAATELRMGYLPDDVWQGLALALDDGVAPYRGPYRIALRPLATPQGAAVAELHLQGRSGGSLLAGSGGFSATAGVEGTPFARFERRGNDLWLCADADPLPREAAALANCVLKIQTDDRTHFVQLRRPEQLDAVPLDFAVRRSVTAVKVAARPPDDKVFLEVLAVEGIKATGETERPLLRLPLNRRGKLLLPDVPGGEIQCSLSSTESGYQLVLEPSFRIAANTYELTVERVENAITGLKQKIARDKASYAENRQAVPALANRIQELQRITTPNTPAGAIQRSQINAALIELDKQLKKAQTTVQRLERSIPSDEVQLNTFRLVQSWQQQAIGAQARLRYRVAALGESTEVELAVSDRPAGPLRPIGPDARDAAGRGR